MIGPKDHHEWLSDDEPVIEIQVWLMPHERDVEPAAVDIMREID